MITKLQVYFDFASDFHVGTGAGSGRVVDAVIARTASGSPVVPGSTIKGLARDAAASLPECLRSDALIASVFGLPGKLEGAVRFGDALPVEAWVPPSVHGRSARDKTRNRALEGGLFTAEDATACTMGAEIRSTRALHEAELVLLITALRRIEAIGGHRRRGKGQVSVRVKVLDGPSGWRDTEVPGSASVFEQALRRVLDPSGVQNPVPEPMPPSEPVPREAPEVETNDAPGVLWVVAYADAPLVLSATPEVGNTTKSLTHVSGTSLRGAIAGHLLRHGWGAQSASFQAAFVREQVHFGPLYPCEQWNRRRSFPLLAPASLLTCKYHPGLRADDWRAHGVVDVLAPPVAKADGPVRCEWRDPPTDTLCGAPLSPIGTVLQTERDTYGRDALRTVKLATTFAAHIRVDPGTQRAAEHVLYGQERLAEGTWFAGYIWGSPKLLDAIRAAVDGQGVAVGKARTRGHGDLILHLRKPGASEHPVFPGLLIGSNTDNREAGVPGSEGTAGGTSAAGGFTLTLYSDLIALDCLLRPVTRLDGAALWTLLGGQGAAPFELVKGYAATRTVLGFNGVPGRPRTPDLAIVAGSTWRYRWTDLNQAADTRDKLSSAQARGLGLRRGEGFGRVVVDLPLHTGAPDPTRLCDPDPGFAQVLPQIPPGRTRTEPRHPLPAPSVPPPLRVQDVPAADRAGLARLLWGAVQAKTKPESAIEDAIKARKERGKSPSGTDAWLAHLLERKDATGFLDELRVCARALESRSVPPSSTAPLGARHD
ncbi:MAG: hypothetical protein H6716_27215 [Polyangiaceae bacterium]|nr:hypothetical protein [Polyangiaceae bacterium]